MKRVGSGLLALGGVVLAGLMIYTLALDGGRAGGGVRARGEADVAVFFPERSAWVEFRQGVAACEARGLARVVEEGDDTVVVATSGRGRRVRFSYQGARGVRETKDEVRRLVAQARPPLAVVGSTNTVLTVALAEALRGAAGPGRGPVLLVPWASTVLTERAEPGAGPVALLDIHQGRTFRFCPDNQAQADLVVGCVSQADRGLSVGRADLVVDRHDPYSMDMADSFHRVIERLFPDAELVEHADTLAFPGLAGIPGLPSPSEDALAESICRDAEHAASSRTRWVVLPLQEEPARRMLLALGRHARARSGGAPLRVVCGDGLGVAALASLAGQCPFPVWSVSSVTPPRSDRAPDAVPTTDAQVCAEVVSAVLHCLDTGVPTADGLRDGLAALDLKAGDQAALGRALAFLPSGERKGDAVGRALEVRPDSPTVFARVREPSGQWSAPTPVANVP